MGTQGPVVYKILNDSSKAVKHCSRLQLYKVPFDRVSAQQVGKDKCRAEIEKIKIQILPGCLEEPRKKRGKGGEKIENTVCPLHLSKPHSFIL